MRYVWCLAMLLISFAHADECRHRVIFLPQTHELDNKKELALLPKNMLAQVASSQLKIMRFLDHAKGTPVFAEQAGKDDFNFSDMVGEQAKLDENRALLANLPEDPFDLTKPQAVKLISTGAVFWQLGFKKIDFIHHVYPAENEHALWDVVNRYRATHAEFDDQNLPPEVLHAAFPARERAALTEIKNFFAKNETQKDVILVFGANHNFRLYPDLFPPECVQVAAEFKNDDDGRLRRDPNAPPPSPVECGDLNGEYVEKEKGTKLKIRQIGCKAIAVTYPLVGRQEFWLDSESHLVEGAQYRGSVLLNGNIILRIEAPGKDAMTYWFAPRPEGMVFAKLKGEASAKNKINYSETNYLRVK